MNKREVTYRIDSRLRTMHKTKRVERKCNAEWCDIRDMYARVVTTQHVYTKHLSDGHIYGGIYWLMRFPDIVEADYFAKSIQLFRDNMRPDLRHGLRPR